MTSPTAAVDRARPRSHDWASVIAGVLRSGGVVTGIGNGGSHTQVAHFLAELSPCSSRRGGFVAPLGDSASMLAIANDIGFEAVFAAQIGRVSVPACLVAVSTSGESPNVLAGVAQARETGWLVLTLFGQVRDKATASFETSDVAAIQEQQLAFLHTVARLVGELCEP